jgi:hypothetical protein
MRLNERFEIYRKETGLMYLETTDREYQLVRDSYRCGFFKIFSFFMDEVNLTRNKTTEEFLEVYRNVLKREGRKY